MKRLISVFTIIFVLLVAFSAQAQITQTITVDFAGSPLMTYCQAAFSYPLSAAVWSGSPAPIVPSSNAGGTGPECRFNYNEEMMVNLASPADYISIQIYRYPGQVLRFYLGGVQVLEDQNSWAGSWVGTVEHTITFDRVVIEGYSFVQKMTFQWGLPVAPTAEPDPNATPEPLLPTFYDGRINDFDTGSPVVLFGMPYGESGWGLHVYAADDSGLLLEASPEEIAAVAECPAENTLIAENEETGVTLYRLPSRATADGVSTVCPFQLNAPTGEAGKTYIIIFDGLQPHSRYESWEEYIGG
jgi:hypothetical protein